MQSQTLLLIDDDDLLRQTLAEQLAGQGYLVSQCRLGVPDQMLQGQNPDVILVEASQDKGKALCQALRDAGYDGPLLALGEARVSGASAGLAKPFRLTALTQKLQLFKQETPLAVSLGDWVLYPTNRIIRDPVGQTIRLTEKEVAILSYLHKAADRVVPREELLGEVWGYSGSATTHTVETHIYRLRRKLTAGELLVTDTGGYRLSSTDPC